MIPVISFLQRRGILALVLKLFAFLAFIIAFVSTAGALTTPREYDLRNRLETRTGGDAYGSNLRVSTYAQTNRLNQVAQRTVPGFAELQGQANAAATVTVDANPTERRGPFWRHELPVNNTGAVHQAFTVIGVLQGAGPNGTDIVSQQTGTVFVARSPQANGFDQAGRLTQDGQWDYQWDVEDRLIRMQSLSEVSASARQRIFFSYDHLGRRTQKLTYKWVNGGWSWVQTRQYLYDGWNLLAELDHNLDLVRTYGWGADLSGTLRGAGGVGGLVFVKQADGSAGFPACDGNGNVTALYSATDGGELARYEHAPFGELLRASGPWASANPFRFSTKYQDDETGWYYYGYRYYGPTTGRWLSRDPLQELGGFNLNGFVDNDPISTIDPLGLSGWIIFLEPPPVVPRPVIPPEMLQEALRLNRLRHKVELPDGREVDLKGSPHGGVETPHTHCPKPPNPPPYENFPPGLQRMPRPSTLDDIKDVIHFLKSKVFNFFDGFFYQMPERPPLEA